MKAILHFNASGGIARVEWKRLTRALPPIMQAKAERLVKMKASDIRQKWNDRFILGKPIKPERILRLP